MGKKTYFTPARKSSQEQINKEHGLAGSEKFFTEVFGAMTGMGAILNKNREIVYANNEFLSLFGIESVETILGKATGEIISCLRTAGDPSGCGNTKGCSYCGIINTVLETQITGKRVTKEAQISSIVDGKHRSYDMSVISAPIAFNGEMFYMIILQDISEAKRRAVLERIFFHDLLNSVGGLYGLLTVLKEETSPEQSKRLIDLSEEASRNIIEEILVQRQIRAAESGELTLNIERIISVELLDSAIHKIGFHTAGKERLIIRDQNSANLLVETDRVLLQRVILNLLKNALEATGINETVTAGIEDKGNKIVFWVKNNQSMPEDIKLQLFHRSFTTKGEGRGLGTYSIRLLTENFLKGKVSFISTESEGTIFYIELFKNFPPDE